MKNKSEYGILIKKIDVFLVNDYLQIKCKLNRPTKFYSFAFYIYRQNKRDAVFRSPYSTFDSYQVRLTEEGEYKVKVFVKNNDTNQIQTMMSSSIQKSTIIDF